MLLANALENFYLDRSLVKDEHIYELSEIFTDKQWIDMSQSFLKGIGKRHQVPGHVVFDFIDISDHFKQHNQLLHKQRIWVVANLIRYWDQIDLEHRIMMGL